MVGKQLHCGELVAFLGNENWALGDVFESQADHSRDLQEEGPT